MKLQVEISLNAETTALLADLTAAIRSVGGTNVASTQAAETSAPAAAKKTAAATKASADKAREEAQAKIEKETKAAEEKLAADAAAKKAKAAEKKETAPAKKAAVATTPSAADLTAAIKAFLPGDLDEEERMGRRQFAKTLLTRFGAERASDLAEEHRLVVINLLQRRGAGEDLDPETADYVTVVEDEEDDLGL